MKFKTKSVAMLCEADRQRTGKMRRVRDSFFEAADNVFDRESAGIEELFHEFVVAFGDHFNQRFVGGIGSRFLRRGNVAFFTFAIAVGLVADTTSS